MVGTSRNIATPFQLNGTVDRGNRVLNTTCRYLNKSVDRTRMRRFVARESGVVAHHMPSLQITMHDNNGL